MIATDWRPKRVELVATEGRCVDLNPLVLGENGNAKQAALDGGWHKVDRSCFTIGSLSERPVPFATVEAQRLFR